VIFQTGELDDLNDPKANEEDYADFSEFLE